MCFFLSFYPPPFLKAGQHTGTAERSRNFPLMHFKSSHLLSPLPVSPASRGRPPCLLLSQEQIHISIKKCHQQVQPAGAVLTLLPSYQVHRGFHLPSHDIFQQTCCCRSQNTKCHWNYLLVWEKKDSLHKDTNLDIKDDLWCAETDSDLGVSRSGSIR